MKSKWSLIYDEFIEYNIEEHRLMSGLSKERYSKEILGSSKDILFVWKRRGRICFKGIKKLEELGIL